ncbi:MAG: InlB B-repeat-containing protein [Paludibacteraceae bacterium]|nr:InlB B-repeat-containing protein [Paludibacteraceae bacterium]
MMNTLKKIGLTCLLVVIGWGTAAAATHTVTFTGCGSSTNLYFSETPASTTTWSGSGAKTWGTSNGCLRIGFHKNQSDGYLTCGQYPSTWRVTGVQIVSPQKDVNTIIISVNGIEFTKSDLLTGTGSAEPQATNNITIKIVGGDNKYIEISQIIITYESVTAAPVLTYTTNNENGDNETNPHKYTTSIPTQESVFSDQALYTKDGTKLTTALSSGLFELWNTDLTKIDGAVTNVEINTAATIFTVYFDQSKLTNCQTYILAATAPYNENGVAAVGTSLQWYFSTPTITASDLAISGTTEFLTGSTFDHSDWVITTQKGGVDITAQCTNFSNPNMTTAGTKDVTFDYAGCTITTTITITERATYTLTWKNLVTGEAEITTQVQQGNTVGTLPKPATTTLTTACGEKRFVGWTTTQIAGSQDAAPTLVQSSATPTANRILYAVYADATGGSGDTWEKITSTAQLTAGKTYLIGNTESTAVMGSAGSSNNNFKQVGATASGNAITPASGYNAVILGGSAGAWTLQLAGNNEYLYAASSSDNVLKSRAGNDDKNSEWAIEIADGAATVTAQGSNTRKMLRYNTASKLFSCYSSGQQSVSFYLNTGGGTGFITKCNCDALGTPTGLSANNPSGASVDLSWDPVTGATSYLVEYSINSGSTWNSVECTGTPYKLTGLNKSTNYTWRIVALSNDGTHCVKSEASTTSTFTTTSNCAWQINYQQTVGGTWSQANCFSQVSSTEWQLADFTLPASNCNFWVGPGKFDNTYSKNVTFGDNLTFAALQNTACGKPYPGENAVGTLRIYSDSKANNYFVGFMPTYQIAYGLQGSTWEHLPFAYVSGNIYETALTEVPNGYWDNTNYQFYVGAKKTDGGTNLIAGKSNIAAMKTMGGLKDSDISGAKGVYRIYDNSCDNNWYCTFIPYYNIVYYAADNTTVYQTSEYISSKNAERTINVLSNGPVKDGYRFIGWSHTAGGDNEVNPGSSYKLWKCNDPLYPVYIQQVTLNYNTTGGVSVCEANTIDINTKTTVCADAPTREGYKFTVWNTAQDGSGTTYAPGAEITLSENVTLYAQWLPYIKAYYDKTNITFAGTCDASDKQVVKGDEITLCDAPTSPFKYTFQKWSVNGTEYAAGATYTVTGTELEIKITPVWDTPTHEFIFINQGSGTSQEVTIATISGAEGTYITAPASCGTVPTNCEGKVFVGWLRGTYDGTLDGNEGVNTPEQLIAKAKEQNGGAGDVFFASPGQRIKVADQSAHEPANWDKWYAVFAIPE